MANSVLGLILLFVLLVGCSTPIENSAPTSTPSTPPTTESLEISDALRRDAETMADQMGISVDDALRRIGYQDDIGRLCAALAANERDTFAGLWVEHQPEYRIVVQFTRDAEQTIHPYIEEKPWAGLVEVRTASATLSALDAALAETVRALDRLDFDVTTALNVKENRVEVYVTDRAWFEGELRKANLQLPDHVELVAVAGHSAKEIDICAPPSVPGVAFPRQAPVEGIRVVMDAELIGDLVLVDGCLRVNSIVRDASYLPVWPPEFTLKSENDTLQVLDGAGRVVARVGEEVYMGGGIGASASLADCVRDGLPADCTGPYWIIGEGVRPNLRRDSDLFTLDVISITQRSLFLLRKKPVLDEWAEGDSPLIGKLVLYDYQRCPRVMSDSGLIDYLPLWPPDYEARVRDGEVEILDALGQVVARVGEEVVLAGGPIPGGWDSERYRQLHYELPGDCNGPYWIVSAD